MSHSVVGRGTGTKTRPGSSERAITTESVVQMGNADIVVFAPGIEIDPSDRDSVQRACLERVSRDQGIRRSPCGCNPTRGLPGKCQPSAVSYQDVVPDPWQPVFPFFRLGVNTLGTKSGLESFS